MSIKRRDYLQIILLKTTPFKEEHQGLLILYVLFLGGDGGGGVALCGENGAISKNRIFFEAEK